jgi:cell shape-determining protein MreC
VSDGPSYEQLARENAALRAEIGKIDQLLNMVAELERSVRERSCSAGWWSVSVG